MRPELVRKSLRKRASFSKAPPDAFRRSVPAAIAGVILLTLPHLIGAPELANIETNVPSSLTHQFVTAVTVTSLVFWTLLGGLTSAVFARFDRGANQRA